MEPGAPAVNAKGLRAALVETLRAQGRLESSATAAAFAQVPRHLFVPHVSLEEAYRDSFIATKHQPDAVKDLRSRGIYREPALLLLCARMTCLRAGRIDEPASHAREALALTRRLGARASEAHALCLAGEVGSTGNAEDAEGCYRQALALAEPRDMRPLVARCHFGLCKLYRRTDKREQGREHLTLATTMYREMGMTYWLEKAEPELK